MATPDPAGRLQILLTPGLQPPPGVVPNYFDPPSMVPMASAVIGVTLGLMYCFLALRIYTRVWVTHNFHTDDVLCILAAANGSWYCAVVVTALNCPLGRHQWDVPLYTLNEGLARQTVLIIWLYVAATVFLKSALLVFYYRIFGIATGARILIWSSLALIVVSYTTFLVVDTAMCPPSVDTPGSLAAGDVFGPGSRCLVSQKLLWAVKAVFGVVADFYLLGIPVVFIANLRLSPKSKMRVGSIFITGLLAGAFSITAAVYRFQLLNSPDFTWFATLAYTFTAAELNIGIACSCMPVVFTVFRSAARAASPDSLKSWVKARRAPRPRGVPASLASPCWEDTVARKDLLPRAPRPAVVAPRALSPLTACSRAYRMSRDSGLSLDDEDGCRYSYTANYTRQDSGPEYDDKIHWIV
ncbi:hypothetical protein GGS23DRAFT_158503 [Durotheca rogersii]|uniref:uncharacterized protein n=1 Tax=Durotheca rogersii TaxID=419775 RepID=UPI00222085F4|nr:uncharacterized protein GGS23DRAFT_158503 [Durotheca rogersii]KAI5861220.1 hypothetical protein GGS23DRAFT_158503 [Durotheca rogersii]